MRDGTAIALASGESGVCSCASGYTPWACFNETFLICFPACSHLDGYGSRSCIGRGLELGVLGL